MKKAIIVFSLLLITVYIFAQVPDWLWAESAGGTISDYGCGIATDDSGNSYITGYFMDTAYFGTISLTSSGDDDIFVAKLDVDGNWLWAKRAGGDDDPHGDRGYGISIDDSGNCFITGEFWGTAFFGTTELISSGSSDIFVAKLDTNGNWLWAKRAGGSSSDEGKNFATDNSGNSYVTGWFSSANDINFGSISLTSYGYSDAFVAKLDTNGNWLWATHAGSDLNDRSFDIATDGIGNCYITGCFEDTATFATTELISSGGDDIFVARLDINGNWLWAKRAGGTHNDEGYGIGTDSSGNCFATGFFYTTADFGSFSLNSSGQGDIFIAKMDTDGNWLWANQAGGSGNNNGYSISTDSNGNCYATGEYVADAYFGPYFFSNNNNYDIFVTSLDTNGNWLWATTAGGTYSFGDTSYGIATDSSGNCYVTGEFFGAANFGTIGITGNGDSDIFVAKLENTTSANNVLISTKMMLTNYPNPFNPSTTISFSVTQNSDFVNLEIYNIKGKKVKQLIGDHLSVGQHSVVWDGKDETNKPVSSGIYFYKMKTNNNEETKKMILMK
ncbi:MAG: SBBP repeat-containing protein [Candidatus Tenebribacter burtonii]|jgi:hypothetical protein|nr:SBBP repeat-containing protein [Candidatus Tenebribacter burtonii]